MAADVGLEELGGCLHAGRDGREMHPTLVLTALLRLPLSLLLVQRLQQPLDLLQAALRPAVRLLVTPELRRLGRHLPVVLRQQSVEELFALPSLLPQGRLLRPVGLPGPGHCLLQRPHLRLQRRLLLLMRASCRSLPFLCPRASSWASRAAVAGTVRSSARISAMRASSCPASEGTNAAAAARSVSRSEPLASVVPARSFVAASLRRSRRRRSSSTVVPSRSPVTSRRVCSTSRNRGSPSTGAVAIGAFSSVWRRASSNSITSER
eukprot:TRINITY_DN17602_c0_g1_i1.p2 TRINITY_DN17602_c0_g1~~TRINITY_DN17602_c0_g1_i1.p2  ORF type:complete len:265 (+),score=14.99 TRINITY_DN17602_c0_g1_i1:176-970(+)